MEVLARQVLQSPVEIQVGGRSVVNKDITQLVEIREEEDRFLRLLEVGPAAASPRCAPPQQPAMQGACRAIAPASLCGRRQPRRKSSCERRVW